MPPGDDAGVIRLDSKRGLVETVDIITPLVNDPYMFGKIATVNSLSDIYAMGGTPLSALSIVGYPACDYDIEVVRLMIKGALDMLSEARVALLGGHCFEDTEIKFGLSVTGFIENDKILRYNTPQAGDLLIITKPIGTGILTTALKGQRLKDEDLNEAVKSMTTLNKEASRVAVEGGASACTDITGFGLLGHAVKMVSEGRVDYVIEASGIPVFKGVKELAEKGIVPEGAYKNLEFYKDRVKFGAMVEEVMQLVLFDPQTSGGLLVSINREGLRHFDENGVSYWIIGRVVEGNGFVRVG